MKRLLAAAALLGLLTAASPAPASASDQSAARAQRWHALSQTIFGQLPLHSGAGIVSLDAPYRALDAALVPVTITLAQGQKVKSVTLVIDANPAPLAARITFGPAAAPHELRLRVRVNDYTDMQAVAETADGTLYMTQRFVKASGGCSAPVGESDAAALAGIGRMKFRLLAPFIAGQPVEGQLMILHPNFNGMQMNQLTRLYTPARFIDRLDITYNDTLVLHMDADISLSTNPAITFGFVPHGPGTLKVVAHDSQGSVFRHSFALPLTSD